MANRNINLNGVLVRLAKINEKDFVSLQDIAKGYNPKNHRMLIGNWMRQKPTIEYLGLWGSLENNNFNVIGFDDIKNRSIFNRFYSMPTRQLLTLIDELVFKKLISTTSLPLSSIQNKKNLK